MIINRSRFLKQLGFLTGTLVVPRLGMASSIISDDSFQIIDLHAHPSRFFMKGLSGYAGDQVFIDSIHTMSRAQVSTAIICTVADLPLLKVTDKGIIYERAFEKGEAWAEFKRQINLLKELIAKAEAPYIRDSSQLPFKNNSKNVNILIASEGGDFIESLDLLDEAFEEGLRSVQLVHYVPNQIGDLQTSEAQHNGLSKLGKEAIVRMNDLGIIIDVAHASEKTVKDVANLSSSPIILSHSILKMEPGRPIEGRAISKDHAKMVAETGGVIGAWPSGFNKSFEDFVDNTLRLVDAVGIDHVGIGTDMDANFKPVIDNYSQLPSLLTALKDRGLSTTEVAKIASGNANRVLKKVLKS